MESLMKRTVNRMMTMREISPRSARCLCIAALLTVGCCLVGCREEQPQQRQSLPETATVLSALQREALLVTTELTIRKIAYYDSNRHERISLADPSTWKVGERKCVVPVEVNIKYGYDLSEMRMESIRIDDSTRIVSLTLPPARVIDSGYDTDIDYDQVVSISTGLRDPIGHETIEEICRKAYESVMKTDFDGIVGPEIRQNAVTLLTAMMLNLGFSGVEINPN